MPTNTLLQTFRKMSFFPFHIWLFGESFFLFHTYELCLVVESFVFGNWICVVTTYRPYPHNVCEATAVRAFK